MKENSIKITKSDGTHVLFSSLDNRQLELLEIVNLICETARNKKLSDKDVGFAVKRLVRDQI